MKILLVDDDQYVKDMLVDLLDAHLNPQPEYIRQSWNGAQALNLYQRFGPYDLVITDNDMPVMKGVDFCKELVKEEVQPRLIVMVTGSSKSELKELPLCVQVFEKGRPLSELVELLKKAMGIAV